MSTVQSWTPERAEAYFNGSLIGQVSGYLTDAIDEMVGSRHQHRQAVVARPGLLDRLEARLWRQEQRRREAWLAQSADVFELERRMRLLDRGNAAQ